MPEGSYSKLKQDDSIPSSPTGAGLDILQFTASIYFLDEAEGELSIDVMRLGPMEGTISCKYETVDGSGKDGISYNATSGELKLGPGEARGTFVVKAVKNEMWAPTMEFGAKLTDPENCQLGAYLKVCRVKVLNDDPFPTNKFDKEAMEDGDIPVGFQLWWEYMKLNYSQPGMAWRTWFVILVDQMQNGYLFFKLWFNVYLVDVVLNTHEDVDDKLLIPGNRATTIVVMGVMWVLPSLVLHLWGIAQLFIGVKGRSVAYLQEALFRKYLNFTEKSRSEVLPSDMIVCVSADCADVAGSYTTAMGMVTGLVKIGIFVNFILRHNPGALWVMGVFPSITIVFSICRLNQQMRVATESGDAEIAMMSLVNEVCQKYRLVADYFQRPYMNQIFSGKRAALQGKQRPEKMVFSNNEYFPALLGFLFVGVYISTASMHVVNKEVSLGTYLATISVFKDVADVFSGIYSNFVSLTKSFEPLGGLTELYNKRTDLKACKMIARANRQFSKDERNALIQEKKSNPNSEAAKSRFVTDLMQIKLDAVTLNYGPDDPDSAPPVFEKVSVTLNQGKLVAVTGPHGAGRATLLKIFGKVIFPTEGNIIIPTHLRGVHVSKEPILMRMTLWENLAFGLPKAKGWDNKPEEKRAIEVLNLFGAKTLALDLKKELDAMNKSKDGEEEEEENVGGGLWQEKLTSFNRASIHLARAFLMNPEILVLQRPLSNFSGDKGLSVLQNVFKGFTQEKGICLPAAGKADRRPRTLFFVPESTEQAKVADLIWALDLKTEPSTYTVKEVDVHKGDKLEFH